MICELCGKSCNRVANGSGWYTHRCDSCFNFRFHDNILSYNPNKLDCRSAEFAAEVKKRWYAIYNFLLRVNNHEEVVEYGGANCHYVYFIFGFFKENGAAVELNSLNNFLRANTRAIVNQPMELSANEINMHTIMVDYPKTRDDKILRILDNLYFKYGTSQFNLNDLPCGLVYDEEDSAFYFQALREKGYIATTGNTTTITLKGIELIESKSLDYKPSKLLHVLGSDRKFIDRLGTIYNEIKSSPSKAGTDLRKLLEDVLYEKHGFKSGNISDQLKKFREKNELLTDALDNIRLIGKATGHTKKDDLGQVIEPTPDECIEAVKIMEAFFNFTFPISDSIDINKFSRFKNMK